ncbi:MAG: hypothetical protein H7067_11095 [Burkholderiales bacterium]|nr:hypothetical protein [Opitutaceae bacterium]
MKFRFHLDTPCATELHRCFLPVTISGWFADDQQRPASRLRIRCGQFDADCTHIDRPDVRSHLGLSAESGRAFGFSARLPEATGRHRLVIEAETASGQLIRLLDRQLDIRSWSPRPKGLLNRLRNHLRARSWSTSATTADSILVLIPVKPGTPEADVEHARFLAERALQNWPAPSRIVFDRRGAAPSRKEHPWRITPLAAIRQGMINDHLRDEHWVFWVDLDITYYPAELISTLVSRAEGGIAAPFVFMCAPGRATSGSQFYDTAGFVEKGRWCLPYPPYFQQPGPVYDLDSVGCCYLVPAELYRQGARHEQDHGSRRWIEIHGESSAATTRRDWHNITYTDHYTVCEFARKRGLPVRAFADIAAYHEHVEA